MPFRNQRPTLTDLITRIQNDFISRLSLVGSVLRRSFIYVLSRVIAGSTHELYGQLEFLSRQIFPDLSEDEYLERQGSLYGVTRNAATFAVGQVTFTGVNGTPIPEGTLLQRADGARYLTQADVTISAGSAVADIEAELAGSAANAESGTILRLVSPIVDVSSDATVGMSAITLGNDRESIDSYRKRVIARLRKPPQGGAKEDYVTWAKEVPGVTRAWCFPLELGAGQVTVRFLRDNDASIIPDAGEVTQVADYIEARRPATATVTVVAPVAVTRNFTLSIVPDTTANRQAVEAELRDLLLSEETMPGGTLLLTRIGTAIAISGTVTDYEITVPNADVVYTTGQLPVFGAITWV